MPEEEPIPLVRIISSLETLHERHQRAFKSFAQSADIEVKARENTIRGLDRTLERRDAEVEFLKTVIEGLCNRIERTQQQLQRDNRQCVYSEPLDIMNLLGRETDWVKVVSQARDKARNDAVKRAKETCACGARNRPFPARHGAKGCAPEIVQCHCGKNWIKGDNPDHHTEAECWIPCRICGHHEDRHTESLPEEGSRNYCADCSGALGPFVAEDHAYDGARSADWDKCRCGHQRGEHKDLVCSPCAVDEVHEFALEIN